MDIMTYSASVAYTKKAIANGGGGGSGGTTNYNALTNKPSINGVELVGNQTAQDLDLNYILNLGEVQLSTNVPQQITLTDEQIQQIKSDNHPTIKFLNIDTNMTVYLYFVYYVDNNIAYSNIIDTSEGSINVIVMFIVDNTAVLNMLEYKQIPDSSNIPANYVLTPGGWAAPTGGGSEREWTQLGVTDCSQVGGNIIYSGLDNYTEFLILADTVKNDSATASAYDISINDIPVVQQAITINKDGTSGNAYQWCKLQFDGLVWDVRSTAVANLKTNLRARYENALYPYNFVMDVGKASKFELQAPVAQYQAVSGKITVWGR